MKSKLFIYSMVISLVWIGGLQTWSMGQAPLGKAVPPRNNAHASTKVKRSSGAVADRSAIKRQTQKKSALQAGAGDPKAEAPATMAEVTPANTSAEVAAQEQHRQSLDEQFRKVSLLIQDGKSVEAAA